MINQLREISRIILLPTIVLYFFGFVVVSASLARFGIISFDIVNARFILAGFYPLIAMAVAFFLAWHLYQKFGQQGYLNVFAPAEGWRPRYGSYLTAFFYIWIAAQTLTALFNLGRSDASLVNAKTAFSDYGRYDFVGRVIEKIPAGPLQEDVVYVLKMTTLVFVYAIPLVLLVIGVVELIKFVKKFSAARRQQSTTAATGVAADPAEISQSTALSSAPVATVPPAMHLIVGLADLWILFLFLTAFTWSSNKIRAEAFDFSSFSQGTFGLSSTLMFAWLFDSICIFYFFLLWFRPNRQFTLAVFKPLEYPLVLPNMLQQLFIPVLLSLFAFGATIFPRIPYPIGGGEPRAVQIRMKDVTNLLNGKDIFLLGESSQFLFVVDPDTHNTAAFEVNKDAIEFVETRHNDQK